jgi:hypothetical protein
MSGIRAVVLAFLAGAALICSLTAATSGTFARKPSAMQTVDGPIKVSMRDVTLYPYRDAPSYVYTLVGSVAVTRPRRPVVLDDISSYGVEIEYAKVRLSAASLSVLMNRYILPASNGPLKHVDVTYGAGTLGMSGIMQKGKLRVRFRATGVAQPTTDGDMRIRITKMVAGGIASKGLLDALGLKLQKVAEPHNMRVFRIVGDDMIVPIVSMFPPPRVSGRLRAVSVSPSGLVAIIGSQSTATLTEPYPSFIHFRGGMIKFARLTMQDVDLTVLPQRKGTLGFSSASYYRQMTAGVAIPQPNGGLITRIPNYNTLVRK